MSRQKKQGTEHETDTCRRFHAFGLRARRLAEGGNADEGDVEMWVGDTRYVIECKATERLSVHKALAKAQAKAGPGVPVALVWKQLVAKPGNSRRTSAGTVVVQSFEGWVRTLQLHANQPTEETANDHA